MSQANAAKRLLSHYLRQASQASGVRWDSDNDAEVGEIVDAIIAAAREGSEVEESELLQERRRTLERLDGLRRGMGLE